MTTVDLEREPGHLYFIDKDGDLAKRRRNPGHHPKSSYNFPNKKVLKLGIQKRRGYLYFLDGQGRVISQPMRQFSGKK